MNKLRLLAIGLLFSLTACAAVDPATPTGETQEQLQGHVCTLLQPYCPPECNLVGNGCPQQCHCPNGNYVLCGDKHCPDSGVCCTGPVTTDPPVYTCYPAGSVCPL